MIKRFVIGDIHGRVKALEDVLKKSNFNKNEDLLIILGDVVDGGHDTNKVIDELLSIKNFIFILGNHDNWFMNYTFKNKTPLEWINQGGANTLNSYGGKVIPANRQGENPIMIKIDDVKIPKSHVEFFENRVYYYKLDNMLFVHGGFDPGKELDDHDPNFLLWDRTLIKYADKQNISGYDKVFIGHTSTQSIEREWVNYMCRSCKHVWEEKVTDVNVIHGKIMCKKCASTDIFQSLGCTKPLKIGNLFCLDTGAGWDGKLTIMDINSEEFWQSELQETPIKKR